MNVIRDKVLTESWVEGTTTRSRFLLFFGVIVPVLYFFIEWFLNNFLRLIHRGPAAFYPDYDWGLAGLIHPANGPEWSLLHRLANAGFDLLAFFSEGLLIAATFLFFLLLLDLARVLPGTQPPGRGRETPLILIPDKQSEDERRGFEVFADPLHKTLLVALFSYLILYCVRLEGVYMKSTEFHSLAEFVQGDIWSGVIAFFSNDDPKGKLHLSGAILKRMFSTGDETVRGILAALMAVLIFTFSLIVVLSTVQKAASQAKKNGGIEMAVWPLKYLRLYTLVVMMLLATVTLYFYRIGLVVASFVVAGLLVNLVRSILAPPRDSGNARSQAAASDGG